MKILLGLLKLFILDLCCGSTLGFHDLLIMGAATAYAWWIVAFIFPNPTLQAILLKGWELTRVKCLVNNLWDEVQSRFRCQPCKKILLTRREFAVSAKRRWDCRGGSGVQAETL